MTFREARNLAAEELAQLDDPELEAELLLRHLMGWTRHMMILSLGEEMPAELQESYRELVRRRAVREPLQHITGTVEFMGREFHAGPGALVPRPETETLTELFIAGLDGPGSLLEVGTGSGVIAVSLAVQFPEAAVTATDVSRRALRMALRNRNLYGTANLFFIMGDLLEAFRPGKISFDGIVANLPYVPSRLIDGLQPEVSRGDPRKALDGGEDGLDIVRALLESAPPVMAEGGLLALELDPDQVRPVQKLLNRDGRYVEIMAHRDLTDRPRFITARKGTEAFN